VGEPKFHRGESLDRYPPTRITDAVLLVDCTDKLRLAANTEGKVEANLPAKNKANTCGERDSTTRARL
jgi:hypothetical protein